MIGRKLQNSRIVAFASIYPPPYFGGAESTFKNLVDALTMAQFNDIVVHAINVTNKKEQNLEDDGIPSFVKFHRILNFYNPFTLKHHSRLLKVMFHLIEMFPILEFFRVIKIVLKEKPKIIMCHNLPGWSYSPFLVAKIFGIKIIKYNHDFGLMCVRSTLWKPDGGNCTNICTECKLNFSINKYLLRNSTLIFNSKATEDTFREFNFLQSTNRLKIVYPIGDISHINLTEFRKLEKQNYSNLSSMARIGFIGRIHPSKGVELLLEAGMKLNLQITLAGTGEKEYITSLSRKYPNAIFLGHMNKDDFFSEIDIVVIPSEWREPFGKVALEAILAGKRTIVSDIGGLVEAQTMLKNELTTFRHGDLESLTQILNQCQQNYSGRQAEDLRLIQLEYIDLERKEREKFIELVRNELLP